MSPAEIYIYFLETHTKKKDIFFFLPADPEWCLTEGQEMVQFLNSFDITATQWYLCASYIGMCLSERMVLISTVKINSYIDVFNKKRSHAHISNIHIRTQSTCDTELN